MFSEELLNGYFLKISMLTVIHSQRKMESNETAQSTSYKIKWVSTSGRSGESKLSFDNRESAQEMADDLNEQYPECAHYVVGD